MCNRTENGKLAVKMQDSIACLAELSQRKAEIVSVVIDDKPEPVITLARKPRRLKGDCFRTEGGINSKTYHYQAKLQHCCVTWKETA